MPQSGKDKYLLELIKYKNNILKRKIDACDPQDIDKFVEYHTARGENLTEILSKVTRIFLLFPTECLLLPRPTLVEPATTRQTNIVPPHWRAVSQRKTSETNGL